MPSEEFFHPKKPEKQFETELDPSDILVHFMSKLRAGEWMRFIVTENSRIILSTRGSHSSLLEDLGIKRNECIIDDGLIQMDSRNRLRFAYHRNSNLLEKAQNYTEKTESEIEEWLKSKGL